ncbi:hypothetical protein ADIAL_1142 [Alkalibacterium sp. AK22]|nr:hypothetical protein ADIAL_1142 [Alkalibacterium sp. AK22]
MLLDSVFCAFLFFIHCLLISLLSSGSTKLEATFFLKKKGKAFI